MPGWACRYETRFITKDGKIRWVEVYGQLSLGAEGQLLGISGSLTDITERKIAEIQIKKLAAKWDERLVPID